MQGPCKSCILQEKLSDTQIFVGTQENNILPNHSIDIFGMAELVAGYMDCMEEALRYLKDVEQYSEDHPAVLGLQQHLSIYQQQLLTTTETHQNKENLPPSSESSTTILNQKSS